MPGHSRARTCAPHQDVAPDPISPNACYDNSYMQALLMSGPTDDAGVAGAAGRNLAVQAQMQRAYNAGRTAPQSDYSGEVYRNVTTDYAPGMLDWQYTAKQGTQMRYNAGGEPMVYTSETAADNTGEMSAYPKANGQPAMANRTMTKFQYDATVDPTTGEGGVADVAASLEGAGVEPTALTVPKGAGKGPLAYRIAGESPYSMGNEVSKGAADAGASALRGPSAAVPGADQIDIIPRNTDPTQITPIEDLAFDAAGKPATSATPSSVRPMPVDTSAPAEGPIMAEPGEGGRAGSARYGAVGAGLMTAGTDLYRMAQGQNISAGQFVGDVAGATALGGASGAAFDALAPALGGGLRGAAGAGGIIGGVVDGAMSTWNNASAYQNGQETAAQATANVAVDTTVGVGAGVAGAALGAAIGSIIPGAGTLVGAGVGFLAGMIGSYAVHALADHSGFTAWAKEGLGSALSGSEDSLRGAWDGIAGAKDAVVGVGSEIASGASNLLSGIGTGISSLWGGLTGGGEQAPAPASDAGAGNGQEVASNDIEPSTVAQVMNSSGSPSVDQSVASASVAPSDLVCDAANLAPSDRNTLMSSVDPREVADAAAQMSPTDMKEAACQPEARDMAAQAPKEVTDAVKKETGGR